MPPPRSKSPIKTYLQSPPKRHPSLGPISSPTRGSIVVPNRANVQTSVIRRLDFSIDDQDRIPEKASVKSSPRRPPGSQKSSIQPFSAKLTNGTRFSPITKIIPSPYQAKQRSRTEQLHAQDDYRPEEDEAFYPIMDDDYGEAFEQPLYEEDLVRDSTPEADPDSPLQTTRKKPKTAVMMEPAAKPPKRKAPSQPVQQPSGKGYKDLRKEFQDPAEENYERPTKKARGKAQKVESTYVEKVKKRGLKTVAKSSSPTRISSPPEIHRGPPRPRNNRGLYILRRETPDEGTHTRSGRNVVKPVAYWKNETIVYGDDEDAEGDASFLLPTIKEVIRKDHVEEPRKRAPPRRKGGFAAQKAPPVETHLEEDKGLAEPWETSPGRVYGAVRMWNPEDPIGEDSLEKEDEIALSSAAIITRDIGATFQFAKTLTLPFFGSGMVDLPPGAFKKPKNTRRMQMVFFVFMGRVSVTVNDNFFSIGRGGMWQVPRGE
jgi:centromere protein C